MTGPIENNEVIEKIEQQESPEVQDRLKAMYMENMQASEQAGNEDMVKYYQEKLNELEAQNEASDDIRLGGWYAGYTAVFGKADGQAVCQCFTAPGRIPGGMRDILSASVQSGVGLSVR